MVEDFSFHVYIIRVYLYYALRQSEYNLSDFDGGRT